jgi:hypothetical protein
MSRSLSAYPARVEARILLLRGQKVLLDRDLAAPYGIETKTLRQAVKRNIERFPDDFGFLLDREEVAILRSQIVTSSGEGWGGTRYTSMAFTEQGVAMLSSVLRSPEKKSNPIGFHVQEESAIYKMKKRKKR